jgi:hypothetical protein
VKLVIPSEKRQSGSDRGIPMVLPLSLRHGIRCAGFKVTRGNSGSVSVP